MPRQRKELSKAEWKVMKIVWELRKAMAREVYTIAGDEHGWTPATVKTILKRLVDKGYVSTTPVGNGFVYRPAQTALATLQSAADTLLTNAVEGATAPLLLHMVEQTTLDEKDLDALQQLIDERKPRSSKTLIHPRKARSGGSGHDRLACRTRQSCGRWLDDLAARRFARCRGDSWAW